MTPWTHAALIVIGFIAALSILLGWMKIWSNLTDKYPEWLCFGIAVSPLFVALYFGIALNLGA